MKIAPTTHILPLEHLKLEQVKSGDGERVLYIATLRLGEPNANKKLGGTTGYLTAREALAATVKNADLYLLNEDGILWMPQFAEEAE